ncbi:MAG TPA: hypothetical protein VFR75_02305 [Solirubrobacterales bacterium]|nr:hypothetical protein [Solirubrobacterales bacterium]
MKEGIEKTRAWTGLIAVVAAIFGVVGLAVGCAIILGEDKSTIAITTAAFGVISTMVTAYLGIKATANTAKEISLAMPKADDGNGEGPSDPRPAGRGRRS